VKVFERVGESSYKVWVKPGVPMDVHIIDTHMKPHIEDDLTGTGVALYYHQDMAQTRGLTGQENIVHKIKGHRLQNGKWEFLTRWKGYNKKADRWEPAENFVYKLVPEWLKYVMKNDLQTNLPEMLQSIPKGSLNVGY
jgi:hypothetical protein